MSSRVSYSKRKHNFCRNPSRDVGGLWCYTTDKVVDKDLCNIPDCQAPESCVIIATGKTSRRVFLDPQKKIDGVEFETKLWDPQAPDKLYFTFYPREGPENLTFVIGKSFVSLLSNIFNLTTLSVEDVHVSCKIVVGIRVHTIYLHYCNAMHYTILLLDRP